MNATANTIVDLYRLVVVIDPNFAPEPLDAVACLEHTEAMRDDNGEWDGMTAFVEYAGRPGVCSDCEMEAARARKVAEAAAATGIDADRYERLFGDLLA